MILSNLSFRVICCCLPFLLVGCISNKEHDDLNAYIVEIKSQPKGEIDPLPPVRTYDAFVYQAAKLRSPFERPVEAAITRSGPLDPNVKPDPTRPKEHLEQFSLDSLTMVGTLAKWALVKDPNGNIEKVTIGYYMGKNHGRIINTNESAIDLEEIVSDGLGGWVKRPKTIKLSEKE